MEEIVYSDQPESPDLTSLVLRGPFEQISPPKQDHSQQQESLMMPELPDNQMLELEKQLEADGGIDILSMEELSERDLELLKIDEEQ